MRGTLATTKGHRSRSTPLRKPLSPWERLREGTRRQARRARRALPAGLLSPCRPLHNRPRASMGGAGRSCLFSPREKIEMRGTLATTKGHRSRSTPLRKPLSPWERLREGTRRQARRARRALPAGLLSPCRPLHNRPRASMGGAGRSCLFSPREKIEMRGTLATATGYRSPPPSRSVTPVTQRSPEGERPEEEGRPIRPTEPVRGRRVLGAASAPRFRCGPRSPGVRRCPTRRAGRPPPPTRSCAAPRR